MQIKIFFLILTFLLIPNITTALNITNTNFQFSEINTTIIFEDNLSFSSIEVHPNYLKLDDYNISINISIGSLNVTVMNLTTDYKKFNETASDSSGEANHTIGNFTSSTSILIKRDGSNWIQATSNSIGEINFNYDGVLSSTILEMLPGTISQQSQGSSPSSSSNSIDTEEETDYYITESQIEKGYEAILSKKNKIDFDLNNEKHSIRLSDIKNNYVTVILSSKPMIFYLIIDETKKINFNEDDYYDLSIYLSDIKEGKATLMIKKINDLVSEDSSEEERSITSDVEDYFGYPQIARIQNSGDFLVSLIILIFIITMIMIKDKKRKK